MPSLRSLLPTLLVLLLGVLAFAALRHLTRDISYAEVMAQIRATPPGDLLTALLFTALSFVALMGYDASGLRYIGTRLPARTLALGSFAGYALGNTVGMGVLTGGAVRLRVYGAAGLDPGQIARLMGFVAGGFGLGISFVGAIGMLWGADTAQALLPMSATAARACAVLVLVAIGAVVLACASGKPLRIAGRILPLPSWQLASVQVLVSALDILCCAVVLWAVLPASSVSFAAYLAFFALAIALGVISHVPGGIGVFEAVMLLAFKGAIPTGQMAGALLLYRAIYYLAPLALAAVLLVLREGHAIATHRARQQAAELSPLFLSVGTFTIGVMLLISGATPATGEATELLALHIPLVFVEAAHFIGSIAGLGLLFVARGLLLRLDAAWWVAVMLAVLSLVLTLPKGIAIGEFCALSVLALLLLAGRREFDRRASLFAQPFSLNWSLMVGAVLGCVVWLMFFVYRDVDYSSELWCSSRSTATPRAACAQPWWWWCWVSCSPCGRRSDPRAGSLSCPARPIWNGPPASCGRRTIRKPCWR